MIPSSRRLGSYLGNLHPLGVEGLYQPRFAVPGFLLAPVLEPRSVGTKGDTVLEPVFIELTWILGDSGETVPVVVRQPSPTRSGAPPIPP